MIDSCLRECEMGLRDVGVGKCRLFLKRVSVFSSKMLTISHPINYDRLDVKIKSN